MDTYPVPVSRQRFEIEVKRSRFITSVTCVEGRSEAGDFIQQIRDEFPGASHHCWAHVAGSPDNVNGYDQSDDGEPRGSAGKPMLNVLRHSGMGNIVVVVTRYFGGIKLGVGGLVRAYTQSVNEALKQLETRQQMITLPLSIQFQYDLLGRLDFYLSENQITVAEKSFNEQVVYFLQIPMSQFDRVGKELVDISQGQLVIL